MPRSTRWVENGAEYGSQQPSPTGVWAKGSSRPTSNRGCAFGRGEVAQPAPRDKGRKWGAGQAILTRKEGTGPNGRPHVSHVSAVRHHQHHARTRWQRNPELLQRLLLPRRPAQRPANSLSAAGRQQGQAPLGHPVRPQASSRPPSAGVPAAIPLAAGGYPVGRTAFTSTITPAHATRPAVTAPARSGPQGQPASGSRKWRRSS